MRYTLEFTASAAQEFRAVDRQRQRRMPTKVSESADDPFPVGVRKLQGEEDHWGIRVGDYRIICCVYCVEKRRIVIVRIGHRREVYRYSMLESQPLLQMNFCFPLLDA